MDTRYVILNDDEEMARSPQWLQSVENSVRAFVIIDPWVFMANYAITPRDEVCARLDLSAAQPPLIFAIVRAPLEPSLMTANLQGPLVINSMTCRSQQAVLVGSPSSTRHAILPGLFRTGVESTSYRWHHSVGLGHRLPYARIPARDYRARAELGYFRHHRPQDQDVRKHGGVNILTTNRQETEIAYRFPLAHEGQLVRVIPRRIWAPKACAQKGPPLPHQRWQ